MKEVLEMYPRYTVELEVMVFLHALKRLRIEHTDFDEKGFREAMMRLWDVLSIHQLHSESGGLPRYGRRALEKSISETQKYLEFNEPHMCSRGAGIWRLLRGDGSGRIRGKGYMDSNGIGIGYRYGRLSEEEIEGIWIWWMVSREQKGRFTEVAWAQIERAREVDTDLEFGIKVVGELKGHLERILESH